MTFEVVSVGDVFLCPFFYHYLLLSHSAIQGEGCGYFMMTYCSCCCICCFVLRGNIVGVYVGCADTMHGALLLDVWFR